MAKLTIGGGGRRRKTTEKGKLSSKEQSKQIADLKVQRKSCQVRVKKQD